jgi:hypothetical protein
LKIKAIGLLSVNTGNTTIITCMGDSAQLYPIPAGFHDIAIDPELLDKGVKIDGANNISIPGQSALMLNLSPRFGRIEVVTLTKEDAQFFFQAVQSDPDVIAFSKQIAEVAKLYVDRFISDVSKVLELLPEDGPTAKLVKQIEAANWSAAALEVVTAVKIALPELWASVEKSMSPDTLAWLNGQMK